MPKQQNQTLETMRHSCSHLLAMAVHELYPDVKFGIGPAIENGFYYDFDFSEPISENDLLKIEEKMKELQKQKIKFERIELPIGQGSEKMKKLGQPYKVELIKDLKDKGEGKVTFYQSGLPDEALAKAGDFFDLCAGLHVKDTSEIGAFKLLSLAGAYWKGDEKNKMLTRIYGACFPTKKELDHYLWQLEEAKKRDHRKLGKELDLFSQHDLIGPGLILWHPNLSVIREEIEIFWRQEHRRRGYQYVYTPHIGQAILWQTSGHTDFYKELMFPALKDERDDIYYLKPMNCPFHMLIFNSRPRSYRELPIRWGELGTVYRYELEGVRHGILRPRGFTQDDAHIICTKDQIIEELEGVLDFAIEINKVFGFEKIHYELSIRDPEKKEKYVGKNQPWEMAEKTLKNILDRRQVDYTTGVGEAKFYGPAIDLKIEDAMARLWQGTTIQFDFNLPEKFDMKYIGPDGNEHQPYMIHRTVLGSMERFVGTLIEQYAGAFPVWLSPMQAVVIPVSEKQIDFAQKIANELRRKIDNLSGPFRIEVDEHNETLPAKIRDAQLQKIPYMLIVGNKEADKSSGDDFYVSVRLRDERDLKIMPLNDFILRVKNLILDKSLKLW